MPQKNASEPFAGFTSEAGAFLWELSFNNERPWFLAHKEQFEQVLNRPFRALCAETEALLNARCADRRFDAHASRIYRDARRLFGRGPYKDNLWFVLTREEQRREGPAFWFEIGRVSCSAGVGFWDMSSATAEAFRRQIDANPARFERIVDALDPELKLWGQTYKRPKGERGEKLDPWYNRKTISLAREWDLGGAEREADFAARLAALYVHLMPLYDFLYEAWAASAG